MSQHIAVQHMRDREARVKSDRSSKFSFHAFPIPFLIVNNGHCMMAFGQTVIERESLGCCLSSPGNNLSPGSRVIKKETGPTVGQSAICGGVSRVQLNSLIEIIDRFQYAFF